MKKIIVVALCLLAMNGIALAGDGDTTKINFFTKYDLQQWKGSWYHKKFDYIDPSKKYKKAYIKLNLGCASYGCCVWDYGFHVYISKLLPGSDTTNYHKLDTVTGNSVTVVLDSLWINRKSDNYEVGRLITPYGTYMRANSNGFNNNTWSHPYIYDVTDYLPLLKDSFGISVQSGGYDGKKGFNMTTDLILIEGETTYVPSQIYKPYQKSYTYKDEIGIDTLTKSFKFKLASNEKNAKFRTIVTGHGSEGEFSPIEYRVKLNGNQIYAKRLWKTDCDKTYIQPQGGTWIFSRCNWCPGEKTETFEIDLSPYLISTDSNEIDVAFGAIETSSTTITANYDIAGHVITYTKKDSFDLTIEDVISPSNDPNYRLYNSACQGPIIRLRNNGKATAKEAYIDYWVDGNNKTTHIWKGTLSPDQTVDISLPAFPWNGVDYTKPIFYALLQKTKQNMTTWNDMISSPFTIPTVFTTSSLKFETKTTNDTKQNTLTLTDEKGNTVLTKTYTNDSKTYNDTISLPDGCYRVELTDYDDRLECGDGLSFWWSTQQMSKTSGSFRILNAVNNTAIKTFNPDFGGKISFQFTINNKKIGEYTALTTYNYTEYKFPDTIKTFVQNLVDGINTWNIYPNPTTDNKFSIELPKNRTEDLSMSIYDMNGKEYFNKNYSPRIDKDEIKTSKFAKGIYIIRLNYQGIVEEKKIIVN